jgi:hypothetical protein
MSDTSSHQTSCLCGAVKMTAATVNPNFTVCHCNSCRSWGGGPFFAVQCGSEVSIDGVEKVKIFDSSAWAERGFCVDCGTHLFYRLKKNSHYNMPLGLFPSLKDATMSMQYFSDLKPDYYCFSNKTREMTEAEILAYFASEV